MVHIIIKKTIIALWIGIIIENSFGASIVKVGLLPSEQYQPEENNMEYIMLGEKNPYEIEHDGECNCDDCHALHIQNSQVYENSESVDFPCCKDQMRLWKYLGYLCEKHPGSNWDGPTNDDPRIYCYDCDREGVYDKEEINSK